MRRSSAPTSSTPRTPRQARSAPCRASACARSARRVPAACAGERHHRRSHGRSRQRGARGALHGGGRRRYRQGRLLAASRAKSDACAAWAAWRLGACASLRCCSSTERARSRAHRPVRDAGFAGVMLDTADKRTGALPELLAGARAAEFVNAAQGAGLFAGFAGSLRVEPRAAAFGASAPTCWASAAACAAMARAPARSTPQPCAPFAAAIAEAVCRARALPRGAAGCYGAPATGTRRMSDKQSIGGKIGRARSVSTARVRDRIFVRGLVLPVAVGVYDEEQGVTQKVSFTVEAAVAAERARPKGDAIAEVPSYDDLVGAVRAVVADGHINLVETLAERIAEQCLRDKRIVSVLVRVEKLERGPASVGVEIVRPRMAVPTVELATPQTLSARSLQADRGQARRQPRRERAARLRSWSSSATRARAHRRRAGRRRLCRRGAPRAGRLRVSPTPARPPHGAARHAPDRPDAGGAAVRG